MISNNQVPGQQHAPNYYAPGNASYQQFTEPVAGPILHLPATTEVRHTGQEMYDVIYPAPQYSQYPGYQMYPMPQQQIPQHMQNMGPQVVAQPPQPAPPQRKKKVLCFVDPNTQKEVDLAGELGLAGRQSQSRAPSAAPVPQGQLQGQVQQQATVAPQTHHQHQHQPTSTQSKQQVTHDFSMQVASRLFNVPTKQSAAVVPEVTTTAAAQIPTPQKTPVEQQQQQKQQSPIVISAAATQPTVQPTPDPATKIEIAAAAEQPKITVTQQQQQRQPSPPKHQTTPTPIVVVEPTPAPAPTVPESQNDDTVESAPTAAVESPTAENVPPTTDSPAATTSTRPKDRKELYDEYCSRMHQYLQQEKMIESMQKHTYPRELIELLRNAIRDFKTTPCPLTDQQLSDFHVDKATMLPTINIQMNSKTKYVSSKNDSFCPSWAPSSQPHQQRKNYGGRLSEKNKNRRGGGNDQNNDRRPYPGRQSHNRHPPVAITRGENAWVPVATRRGVEITETDRTAKEVRGILNKITPSTKDDLCTKLINMTLWRNEELLQIMVDLIFKKAVEEQTFVKLYSDLCLSMHQAELRAEPHLVQQHKMTKFFYAIISTAQRSFENQMVYDDEDALEAKIAESTDEAEIARLSEDLEDLQSKNKRHTVGTIRFITHLFRIGLLRQNILQVIIKNFIKSAENSTKQLRKELNIEYAVLTIEGIGQTIAEKATDPEKDLLKQLIVHIAREEIKKSVSNRVRFMILGLEDLQAGNWKKKSTGPMTKDEMKKAIQKEQEQNEQERKAYDERKKRDNGPSRYQQRGSTNNSKQSRQTNAIVAASQTTSTTTRKETSLNKIDQAGKLAPAAWSGARAGAGRTRYIAHNSLNAAVPQRESNDVRNTSAAGTGSAPGSKDASRSASVTPPPTNDPSSSQVVEDTPEVQETEATEEQKTRFRTEFGEVFGDIVADVKSNTKNEEVAVEETYEILRKWLNNFDSPKDLFKVLFYFTFEYLKPTDVLNREILAYVMLKFTQDEETEGQFFEVFDFYCNHTVEWGLSTDVPFLMKAIGHVLSSIVMVDHKIVQGERPSAKKLNLGLKHFHDERTTPFVYMLAGIVELMTKRQEHDIATLLQMTLTEFIEADPSYGGDKFDAQYKAITVDVEHCKTLYELLHQT